MRAQTKLRQVFSLAAPDAQQVLLAGDFTAWQEQAVPLKKNRQGIWQTTLALEPGKHEYRFLVDGQWQNDPNCALRRPNDFGSENCVCVLVGDSVRRKGK
jgi:1,4-alpha-glucan branching enzyme